VTPGSTGNIFNNLNTFSRLCVSAHSGGPGATGAQSGSNNISTLDFSTLTGGVVFMNANGQGNITLALTNVPTHNTSCIYTLTFRFAGTTGVGYYANSFTINDGDAITPTYIGGVSSISLTGATIVYQTVHIVFNGSTTPTVSTSVVGLS
jgi:hypothetical protein